MPLVSWLIVLIPLLFILGIALYSARYVRGVADYLAAGRVAGRYVISVGDLSSGLGVITLVAMVEKNYQAGIGVAFWQNILLPISMVMSLTGYCIYRFRATRSLSLGQFLEIRYSRRFRIVAATLRTFSEMMTNAIGPAVAARFFIYFLGFPHTLHFGPVAVPTFAFVMGLIILMAMVIIWPGGRVSLLITDCIQSLMSYPIFVIFTVFVLTEFSYVKEIGPILLDRAPGESFMNPYDITGVRDFNLFAIFVTLMANILNRASWIGNDTSTSGRTPHEQKMASILGAWRNGFAYVMCTLIGVMLMAVMNLPRMAPQAKEIRVELANKVIGEVIPDENGGEDLRAEIALKLAAIPEQVHTIGVDMPLSREVNLETPYIDAVRESLRDREGGMLHLQEFRTLYNQMMLPVALQEVMGPILIGLFCLLMVMLMLTTDDSRILNASSTLIQDVFMPLRTNPFTKEQHFRWLRLCSLGVCVFFFTFSLFFSQLDYIDMFTVIFTSLWLGGAGPVMVFGLYSRFGNVWGAWASIIGGCGVSFAGVIAQQMWPGTIYPWLAANNWVDAVGGFLVRVSAPFDPYIVWKMNPEKFPINSQEIYCAAMLTGMAGYILFSLLARKKPFNLDRMLHRGKYAVEGENSVAVESGWSWRSLHRKLLGFTPEYTRGDKIITWGMLVYSLGYQFGLCFIAVVIWNFFSPFTDSDWIWYFFMVQIVVAGLIGIVSTVWFTWGGLRDIRQLFRDLEARRDNPLDDGWVDGDVSRADEALMHRVEGDAPPADEAK